MCQGVVVFDIDGEKWTLDLRPGSRKVSSIGCKGQWLCMQLTCGRPSALSHAKGCLEFNSIDRSVAFTCSLTCSRLLTACLHASCR